jgi:hypothetical protein
MEAMLPQAPKYLAMSLAIHWAVCEKMSDSIFLEQCLSALNLNTMYRPGWEKSYV